MRVRQGRARRRACPPRPSEGEDFLLELGTGKRSGPPENTSLDDPASYAISRDGSSGVFTNSGSQIYVANVDGTEMRLVADQSYGAFSPSWSPDGSAIVFIGRPEGSEPGELTVLVLDLATGQITPFVVGAATRLWLPSYSPDGGTILFTAGIGGEFGLWTVLATGGEPALLLKGVALRRLLSRWFDDHPHGPRGWQQRVRSRLLVGGRRRLTGPEAGQFLLGRDERSLV